MDTADKIKNRRLELGLSQRRLANMAGVDDSTVTLIETRKRKPSYQMAQKLAHILGNTPEYYLVDDESASVAPRPIGAIIAELESVQPIAIPIVHEGCHAANGYEAVDYAYWARPKVAGKNILGVIVQGECLTPDISPGDVLFADTNLSPKNRDMVICLHDGKLIIRHYRVHQGKVWLESNDGQLTLEECEIQGVVIEKNIKFGK